MEDNATRSAPEHGPRLLQRHAVLVSLAHLSRMSSNGTEAFKNALSDVLWRLNAPEGVAEDIFRALDLAILNERAGAAADQTLVLEDREGGLALDTLLFIHDHDLPTPEEDHDDANA